MRKLMMAVATVAGLAVMTGCQRGGKSEEQAQREDVAQAQQEVGETQKEAGEEVAEAQKELGEEQQELSEAQRQQQQAQAGATTVQGSLQSKDNDLLVLTVPAQGNRQLRLKTDDQTRVMQNNREVKLDDIQEGSQVRASYVAEGDDMVARDVTVVTPAPKK